MELKSITSGHLRRTMSGDFEVVFDNGTETGPLETVVVDLVDRAALATHNAAYARLVSEVEELKKKSAKADVLKERYGYLLDNTSIETFFIELTKRRDAYLAEHGRCDDTEYVLLMLVLKKEWGL